MSNCDDLLRQIAELKQRLAKETADMDQTQRVSRLLSNEQTGDPATQMLRRFLGAMDSDSIRQLVRRSLIVGGPNRCLWSRRAGLKG